MENDMNKYIALCLLVMQSIMMLGMNKPEMMHPEKMEMVRAIFKKRTSISGDMSVESGIIQSSEVSVEQKETHVTRSGSDPILIPRPMPKLVNKLKQSQSITILSGSHSEQSCSPPRRDLEQLLQNNEIIESK